MNVIELPAVWLQLKNRFSIVEPEPRSFPLLMGVQPSYDIGELFETVKIQELEFSDSSANTWYSVLDVPSNRTYDFMILEVSGQNTPTTAPEIDVALFSGTDKVYFSRYETMSTDIVNTFYYRGDWRSEYSKGNSGMALKFKTNHDAGTWSLNTNLYYREQIFYEE